MHIFYQKCPFKKKRRYNNKGVDIVIEVHYNLREDPDLIPKKDASWENKLDYAWKGLISFFSNKERGYSRQIKKKKIKTVFLHFF